MLTNVQKVLISNYLDCHKQIMIFLSSAVGKTFREHHNCLGMRQEDSDESCFHQPCVFGTKMPEEHEESSVL